MARCTLKILLFGVATDALVRQLAVRAEQPDRRNQVAHDFGVQPDRLKSMIDDPRSSQRIMIYSRDVDALGPGPRYTVAFRGSTSDPRDWNNNGKNELNFEAPHQANAAQLGTLMAKGAARQHIPIDDLVDTTGHSKGGSEAQAFAAASGSPIPPALQQISSVENPTEAHSMLQVIEALERDKASDEAALMDYVENA